jgi:hypothetical protein
MRFFFYFQSGMDVIFFDPLNIPDSHKNQELEVCLSTPDRATGSKKRQIVVERNFFPKLISQIEIFHCWQSK